MTTIFEGHNVLSPITAFLAKQILGIIDSQIETKCIFNLARILTIFKRYRLQFKILKKMIFVSQNWPNDPWLGCKTSSNFVEFIKKDKIIEKELEDFEGEFEKEEIIDMNFLYIE